MKYFLSLSFLFICLSVSSQNLQEKADAILKEAKELLVMEQASWHATDHFLATYPDKKNLIRGYFSYVNKEDDVVSVFYGEEKKQIFARYLFKGIPSPDRLFVDTENLEITDLEADLLELRRTAFEDMVDNKKGFYSFYENINPNLIPIIYEGKKKVYVISGSNEPKMLIGNDYEITFNKRNKIKDRKKLHKSILTFNYTENEDVESSFHSHVVSDFIDVTDVCSLLLYKKYTGINSHIVVSKKYVSILDLEKETLLILTKKAWDKIMDHQEEKAKK